MTFRYKTGETVLKHFNLTVKPGENIALVGETGAGKSTIVNLVCRFYEPSEGQILIDDVTIASAASCGCSPVWAMCSSPLTCSAAA